MDFGMKTLTVLHHPPAAQLGHVFHRCGMRLNYFWPNVIIYNSGSNACEKGAQWHHAHGMLERMRHPDLLLDVLTYNSTLTACDEGWKLHQGLGLLVGMRHCL